jgi:hypothetical protein
LEETPPAVHQSSDHGGAGGTEHAYRLNARQLVPWMLAGVLAIAALVEGAFLLRRRRPANAR